MVAGRPSPAPLGPVYPAGSALGGGWGLLWPYRSRVFRWCGSGRRATSPATCRILRALATCHCTSRQHPDCRVGLSCLSRLRTADRILIRKFHSVPFTPPSPPRLSSSSPPSPSQPLSRPLPLYSHSPPLRPPAHCPPLSPPPPLFPPARPWVKMGGGRGRGVPPPLSTAGFSPACRGRGNVA